MNPNLEGSDDDASCDTNREEGLECPICWESFNLVENVPYVLWCGHTLCKHCVLGLPWAALKFPTLPLQLPFFISCPWCNLLSPRLIYKGVLRFPRKNYFILWMVESMNGERARSYTSFQGDFRQPGSLNMNGGIAGQSHFRNHREVARPPEREDRNHNPVNRYINRERLNVSLRKSLAFCGSSNSKISSGCDIPSCDLICNTRKCRHLGLVHTHHSSVCLPIFPCALLCLPQFGLVGERNYDLKRV